MATNNRDFRIKNGLVVEGSTATVNGNAIITSASSVNDLADVTVSSPTPGQVLKWNGTAWINDTDATGEGGGGNSFTTIDVPNGSDPVADSATDTLTFSDGANITITGDSSTDTVTVAVDSDITSVNSLTFDTTPTSPGTGAGTIFWDDGDGVPKVILNANVTVGLNQELVLKVKNASGATLTKGSVVYISGAQGQNPTVALADADTEGTSSKTFGFVAEAIIDGAEGFVFTQGILRGVNTEGFTEGGAIWLSSTAGQYTQTIPAEPAHAVFLGYAVKAHATAGEVIVKIQNGYELDELHGVQITGTPADNEVLAYDTTSGLWINQTASEAGLSVVGHTHSLADVTDVTSSAAELNILDGATLSTTELNYVDGVTSAIQTQINGKANTSHTHLLADVTDVTASAAELNILDGATLSTTELNYVDGVTSAIQTQIDKKVSQNFLINGAFDFWQRGTSFTADGYCADRWYFDETGSCTVNQVTTSLPQGFDYGLEAIASTVSDSADLYQPLESSMVTPLRGQTVTFSCYLKMDSNMRSLAGAFELVADYSTSTDARASQITSIGTATIDKSLYADWARASYTFTVPSDAVGLMVGIEPPLTADPTTSATYFVTGAMLELGSVATPFHRNASSIEAELAACQRYYAKMTTSEAGVGLFSGFAYSTTSALVTLQLPVAMRATPVLVLSSASHFSTSSTNGTGITTTAIALGGTSTITSRLNITVSSGYTAGQGTFLATASTSAVLAFNAEL